MKKIRWWPFVLLVCVTVLSACGGRAVPPEAEEGVLIYAALNPVDEELTRSIDEFNDNHPDVRIEIRDYSDEGGPQRLLTELVLGRVPDIMELQQLGTQYLYWGETELFWSETPLEGSWSDSVFWMPYRQLALKGYLEDLWPYIENDPDLGLDGVVQAPLKAAEVNGGLYMLFKQFSITTLMGPASIWGEDRYGVTLDEVIEKFSTMDPDSSILRQDLTRSELFFNLLGPLLDQFIDWETGECSFDGENFRELVDFLKLFPEEFNSPLTASEQEVENGWRKLEGLQLLEPVSIGQLCELSRDGGVFWEPVSYVGYPTADGSFGSCFILHGNKLAMSSVCQNKEAAWEYIRQLIQRSYRNLLDLSDMLFFNEIRLQVNWKDYRAEIRSDLEKFPLSTATHYSVWWFFSGGPWWVVDRPTQEDADRLETMLNKTTQIYWPDDDLAEIVWQCCGPYFAGDRSLDDTIALINNRVGLYVHEQM